MNVKIKLLHPNAVIPSYSKKGDAGLDLTAVTVIANDMSNIIYDTCIAVEIPEGYVGLVFPRSSNCKKDIYLTNSVGVIDSGYRGSIKLVYTPNFDHWTLSHDQGDFNQKLDDSKIVYYNNGEDEHREYSLVANCYAIGDRIGQLIILPYPTIEFEEAEELSETDRGAGGYGSTGN